MRPRRLSYALSCVMLLLPAVQLQAGSAGEWRDSRQIWDSTCGYCHQAAAVGPVLFGRGLAPEYIHDWARSGHLRMPPFPASEISDAELDELARWIDRQPAPAGTGEDP